jgi:hypothetical protein
MLSVSKKQNKNNNAFVNGYTKLINKPFDVEKQKRFTRCFE